MYLQGFGNHHQTEAVDHALPRDQNSPQVCNFGLYAEQLSGTAFTRPRHHNLHTWTYRILPSVAQGTYRPYNKTLIQDFDGPCSPNPMRWSPFLTQSSEPVTFVDGLFHFAGNPYAQVYLYKCSASMKTTYFVNNDGELLFIPYEGEIILHTELGSLTIKPEMIAVIPRGIKFRVELIGKQAQGYLCEQAGMPYTLPQLGIIGANGLANPRHFHYPVAKFEQPRPDKYLTICKQHNALWISESDHSPLNVVAWHGNYAPYSYDLNLFNTINTVSFDHPDPSIYTVLTSESETIGLANLDFVIFPPRWMVAEHSFRPPYFHRNIMNEFMGLIKGQYDAKSQGFLVGGVSIHNGMTAHGPDKTSYEQGISQVLKPEKYTNTLAFMLESRYPWQITSQALNSTSFQEEYATCWQGFKSAVT
ncbi:MAG: homogentisate 1,2-dioxygenase [Legionella sp.]|nr:homogentisate 1,2-dioxygenase [Legionella sp.]